MAHKHKWDWWRRADGVYFHEDGIICTKCKEHIDDDDLINRLNATEKLTAEDARMAEDILSDFSTRLSDALRSYVDALQESEE